MICPIILSGGSGTRLWPISRQDHPKQFATVLGGRSLFETTLTRAAGLSARPPLVMVQESLRFLAAEQALQAGAGAAELLLEPVARNTGPAVLTAALHLLATEGPEALMLVMPSDHVIHDEAAFRAAVSRGIPAAQDGRLVTFGIRPERAETGYGWMELDHAAAVAGDGEANDGPNVGPMSGPCRFAASSKSRIRLQPRRCLPPDCICGTPESFCFARETSSRHSNVTRPDTWPRAVGRCRMRCRIWASCGSPRPMPPRRRTASTVR